MTDKYLDTTGLSYLWNKITAAFASKELLAGSINNKVDKISTSTDNAVVRFNGTSSAIQNSGVTINDSNHVTAAKFITSGGTSSQVVLGNGNLQAANTLPQYEAYLQWGGKNFSASYSPIDAAMVSDLGANRLQFLKVAGITIEYSRDNGTTWQEYPAADSTKIALFSTSAGFVVGNGSAGSSSADYQLRVTINSLDGGIYSTLNKFAILVGTNGSGGCYCTISARTQGNFVNDVDTWTTISNQIPISGWTGYNIINTPGITTCGATANTTQYRQVRFTFGCTEYQQAATRSGLTIYRIMGFGGVGWACPSTMAKTGHLYTFDYAQNATFPAQVEAKYLKKTGGTSSQFLKADGSVDSNTYLTSSSLSTYAPLASPALTGTPTAPTATTGTNTTQIATTAFVQSALGDYDKEPLVIEVNATDTTVPSGTFASIGTALTAGRKVFVKVTDDGDFYLSLLWDISASEFEYRFGSNYAENACYCIIYSNNNIEIGYETFALQNHIHGNIQNGGTLQSNDIDIANGDKLIVTDSSNSARIARTSLSFDGSTTTQALSKKGTWETFLKTAPVTSVNGQTGAVNLTIPTNVSAFTNDAGYATDMNLSTISSSSTSATLSNTNTYYRHLSTGIGTLNVTLPNVSSATKIQHIMLYIKTGSSPTLNITSSGGATITYVDGFEIEASKEYEISFLWNGAKWIVAYNILAS